MEEYLYCRYLPGDIVIFEDDEDAEMLVLGVQKGEGNHPLSYILYDRYMKGLVEITTHHYKIVSRLFDYNNTVYCSYCPYSKKGFTNKSGCSSFCSYYTKTVNDFFYVGDIVYDKSRLATYNIQTLFLNVYKLLRLRFHNFYYMKIIYLLKCQKTNPSPLHLPNNFRIQVQKNHRTQYRQIPKNHLHHQMGRQ